MNQELPNYFIADINDSKVLNQKLISEACYTLKKNRERFMEDRSTQSIILLLAELGKRWLDDGYKFRRMAIEQGSVESGFSAETIAYGLNTFFRELTEKNLEALIVQDLGHIGRLDDLTANEYEARTHRLAIATGPDLLVHIAAGNLPVPALSSIVMGLLVRAAQFIKCASGASLFPRLFAHSIYEMDPKLGSCIEIAEWQGGRVELEEPLFEAADCITITGSDQTILEVSKRIPAHVRIIPYGNKVSFGYITERAFKLQNMNRLVSLAAVDIACWDQCGCLSPHVFYVQQGCERLAEQFAEQLGKELDKLERFQPRGKLSVPDASSISLRRAFYMVRAANMHETKVWQSEGTTAWTVVYEDDPLFQVSCLNRFIYVKGVNSLDDVLRAVEPIRPKVSTVGLAAAPDEKRHIAKKLARWGVKRICPLGAMQSPSIAWRHDGRPSLAELVYWTDLESDA